MTEEAQQVRPRRLPREVRERQILDAAVQVFSQHGYHPASMDEISEVAGVSKPMIYTYLGSKEDLFTKCIRREATRLLEAVAADVEPSRTADMQLWTGLRAFFRYVGSNRQSWTVLHRQALVVGGSFADEVQSMRERMHEMVGALVVSAGAQKGLAEEAEQAAPALAAALVGAVESLATWWLDHPEASDGMLASWVMNLVWLGFGELIEGKIWRPDGGEQP